MPPRPPPGRAAGPRGRPRSLESEQAIMAATLRLLWKDGYAGLTMDRVAAEARASKATMYRRWRSKDRLILAAFSQIPSVVPEDRGSLLADLEDLWAQQQRTMRAAPARDALPRLASECVSNPALAGAMEAFNEQRRVPLRLVFRRAIRRGELPADADLELAIDALQGVLTVRSFFLHDETPLPWARKLFRFIVAGLGGRVA